VSELLSSIVKISHGDLVHLYICMALLPHDLGPKGSYFERDKSGLEGMT
jgi:hypothetical protein